jgi:hypothetical protein
MACIKKYYAPNGKESILYNDLATELGELRAEQQYLTIHSEEFKEQFGDWEKGKWGRLVDDNGEPLAPQIKDIFAQDQFKARIKTQKLTPIESARNLLEASTKISDPTEDSYLVGGKAVPRVSKVVDMLVKYTGTDQSAKDYLESGTRYHKVVEDIIKGLSDGDILSKNYISGSGTSPLQPNERGFLNSARVFINGLMRQDANGIILSELKIASLNANGGDGVAGTIDILHIKSDGTAVLYDLKTGNESPGKRKARANGDNVKIWDPSDFDYYKARRYSYQTLLYAEALKAGDETTGRQPVNVTDIVVVPIEINRNDTDEITDVRLLRGENIRTDDAWKTKSGDSFYKEFKAEAVRQISGARRKSKLSAGNYASDITSFLRTVLDLGEESPLSVEKRARNFVEQNWGVKKFKLKDTGSVTHEWTSDDKAARIEQVRQLMGEADQNFEADSVNSAIAYFRDSRTGKNVEEKYKGQATRVARLAKIFSASKAVSVKALSSLEGFENYKDVVLIERNDGTYDLMTTTNIYPGKKFDVKVTSKLRSKANKLGESMNLGQFKDTILGNYLDPLTAHKAGVRLENTYGDYNRLRLGMIAMELSKANPDMRFSRAVVEYAYSPNTTTPRSVPLANIVKEVKVISNVPQVMNVAPQEIKDLVGGEGAFNPTKFEENPLEDLTDYLSEQLNNDVAHALTDKVEAFRREEITRDDLADEILKGVNGLRDMLRSKYKDKNPKEQRDALSSDPEFMALARAWVTLKGIGYQPEQDVTDEFMGQISKWIKSPTATGRKTLDTFFSLFRQHVDTIKHRTQAFLNEKDPIVNALKRADPFYKRGLDVGKSNVGGTDAITGMGRSVFEPLIVKKKDTKGNTYYTPFLVAKGSDEYAKLSPEQKNFIDFFNNKVQQMFPGQWAIGQIPVIMSSSSTLSHKAKNAFTKGKFSEAMGDYGKSLAVFWTMAAEKGNFRTEREENKEISDSPYDAFRTQVADDGGNFRGDVLERIGLDEDMNLVNYNDNKMFDTDLEKVLTLFTAHYIRNQEMTKAIPMYNIFRAIFKYYDFGYGYSQANTIEMIDEFVDDLAFNIKQGEDKFVSRMINTLVRASAAGLIGLSPKVFIGNTVQMSLSTFSDALVNTMSNDSRFPGMKAWGEASTIIARAKVTPGESRKITLMRQAYLTEDMSVLTGEKYQRSARGIFTEQTMYALDRMMELGFREHYLVAQMIKDGTYDAHRVVEEMGPDGFQRYKLVYDKALDPRFKGADGQKFYEALKDSMDQTGELENGEITKAYDWHLRERLKAYINRGIGTFDRDLASPWARHSFAHALSQFRTWFRDKFQRSTKLEYDAEIFGDFVKNEEGNYTWATEPMKGMLWTLADFATMPGKFTKMAYKGELSREDQRNMWYAMTSLSSFAILALLSAALIDDKDDKDKKEFDALSIAMTNAISEATNSFTLAPVTSMLVSPLVFASYFQRVFSLTGKALMYGGEGDSTKAWNTFVEAVPFIHQLPDDVTHIEE